MTTVINNSGEGSGSGAIIAVIVLVILAILFFVFGLPYLRGGAPAANDASIKVDVPGVGSGSATDNAQ